MKIPLLLLTLSVSPLLTLSALAGPVPLFDGKTFEGWEGETTKVWRIVDGVIVGGSLEGNPRNEFLATKKSYKNFHLRLEYKLVGTEGFINGGVQFRSKRISEPANEMSGFQADIGAGYSGCLYDESRRKKMLVQADKDHMARIEKPGEWNSYEVIATGNRILLFVNGQRTAVWTEEDPAIETEGLIALQIHGNCKAEVFFRNLSIEELPDSAVPPQAEILKRFGDGQPGPPIAAFPEGKFSIGDGEMVVFTGQENLVREQDTGEIEAQLTLGYAARAPRFRSMAWEADTVYEQWRDLNFGAWNQQLETAGATMVIALFGQMEALDGPGRLTEFTTAYHRLLDQFAARTRRVVLVSPIPFEKPLAPNAPDITLRNADVAAYAKAIRELAHQRGAVFVDLYTPLAKRGPQDPRLTEDGIHLTEAGQAEVAAIIARQLGIEPNPSSSLDPLRESIVAKNRLWFDCWRPANWSFVYGDRVNQMYGKGGGNAPSLQAAFEGQFPLMAAADQRIHAVSRGESPTPVLPPTPARNGEAVPLPGALTPEEQLAAFTVADGYEVNLFASEADGVVKPVQFSWDERGRLLVACSSTYPQTLAGMPPTDFIQILEDKDGDGRAETATRFAEGLTMIQGLEPGDGGVYVCDFDKLIHLKDSDGDGRADTRKVIFSGFGIGDTHQLINSICHGPDGSLWFTQGLHAMSRVETPWGIARLDRAAVWRLRPRSLRLDGFFGGGMAGANCWGVAFDDFGQVFHKSGDRPQGYWTVPGMIRGAGINGAASTNLEDSAARAASPEQYHSVGPLFDTSPKTTALEIIGSSALPDDIQGCALIGGYFGSVVELHRFEDAGSGYKTTQLPKLLKSNDTSFRPVDVSVGPDGAIYLADWFNPVIGHYQASYADPRRDKAHGRIWRITAKGKTLVKRPDLASMSPVQLLDQLRSPERWVRYQAKRLLVDLPDQVVLPAADAWVAQLGADDEPLLLEAIGVFEAHEAPRPELLAKLLAAKDPRVRAYGTRVVGNWAERLPDPLALLQERVRDENARVRLEAVVAASYIPRPEAVEIAAQAVESPRDPFLDYAIRQSARALQIHWAAPFLAGKLTLQGSTAQADYLRTVLGTPTPPPSPGQQIYEMACLTCHQPEGKGLPGIYPALVRSDRLKGNPEPLIRIILHGLMGPNTVGGESFGGPAAIPMPPLGGLDDQQIADVLTYVRAEFAKQLDPVTAAQVKTAREAHKDRVLPWTTEELTR